jgi:tetratricopeptide (TPR) repeat protein
MQKGKTMSTAAAGATAFVVLGLLTASAGAQEAGWSAANEEAKALFAARKYAAALEGYRRVVELADKSGDAQAAATAWLYVADCHKALGRPKEALAAAREGLARREAIAGGKDDEQVENARLEVVQLLRALSRPADALAAAQKTWQACGRLFPGDAPLKATCAAELAQCLRALGRRTEAFKFGQAALGLWVRLGDDRKIAIARHDMGNLLYEQGRYDDALKELRLSVEIRERLDDGDNAATANTLEALGACLAMLGRDAEGLPYLERALAMVRRLDSPHPEVFVNALDTLGFCLRRLGRAGDALPLHLEALKANRKLSPNGSYLLTITLANVGMCLQDLGRAGEALPYLDEALAIRRRLFPKTHAAVATALNNKAACLHELGRTQESIPLLEESLTIRRQMLPPDHPRVAQSMNNLAVALSNVGRPDLALPYIEAGLASLRLRFAGDHPETALAEGTLATCLQDLGREAESLPHQRASLEMARRVHGDAHPRVATAYNNLGYCLTRLNRLETALDAYRQSLAIRRRLYKGDHGDVAASLSNLGNTLMDLDRDEEALARLEEAVAMLRRLFPGDHPGKAHAIQNLAVCFRRLDRLEDAVAANEEALAIARRLGMPNAYAYAANMGHVLDVGLNRPADAIPYFAEAIAGVEALRARARLAKRERALYFGLLRRHFPYDGMVRAQLAVGRPDEALRYVERGRARGILDLLDRSRFDPLRELRRHAELRKDEKLAARIRDVEAGLAKASAEVGRLEHGLSAADGGAKLRERLQGARDSLRAAVRKRADLVHDLLPMARSAPPEELQGMLAKDERMLVYVIGSDIAEVLLVPPTGAKVKSFPLRWADGRAVTPRDVASAVESYGAALARNPGAARGLKPARAGKGDAGWGAKLFGALVPPALWKELVGLDRVLIVPHGALHRLPFEALVVAGGPTYWIDAGPPIAYGPSASVLLWCRRRAQARRALPMPLDVLALGDPRFAPGPRAAPLAPEKGILLLSVAAGSAAARAGLRGADVLIRYNGHPLQGLDDLRRESQRAAEAGAAQVEVQAWREGEVVKTRMTPGRMGVRVSRVAPREAWPEMQTLMRATVRGGGVPELTLAPLPGTRREVLSIERALGKERVKVLLGEDARADRLFELAPQARVLHLATHQIVDERSGGSFSRLALTLPAKPTEDDDGFLRLIDLLESWRDRLSACELVVLSACETQSGPMQRDEGVHAFPLGFLYAGAPASIGSLWRVDDASTAELFSGLYPLLKKGAGKLAAFTQARRALRRVHPDPYFWAPFVYIGEP